MRLRRLREQFFIGRYDRPVPLPERGPCFLVRAQGEFSLLAPELPGEPRLREGPWSCLCVVGTLELSLVGIMARLSGILAGAGVPLLAQSSYDTDYLFIPEDRFAMAAAALTAAGIPVEEE